VCISWSHYNNYKVYYHISLQTLEVTLVLTSASHVWASTMLQLPTVGNLQCKLCTKFHKNGSNWFKMVGHTDNTVNEFSLLLSFVGIKQS
jgi:hypothetical protein